MDNLSQQKKLVAQYVQQGNKEAAVPLLFELIVHHAKEKNFTKADSLRETLCKVDPKALTEIVRAGDIIEHEKNTSTACSHLDVWSKLYITLTPEEAQALHSAQSEKTYDAHQPLFMQGDTNSALYFINQGQAKVIYNQDDREFFLKVLGPGDAAGAETFFNTSLCTTTVITLSPTRLNILERDRLDAWRTEFPQLAAKIHAYCKINESIPDMLIQNALNRRTQKRYLVSAKVGIQLLNGSGDPVGKALKGDLSDISAGGMSFFIKARKKESARLLLGRNLGIRFSVPVDSPLQSLDKKGIVTGVRHQELPFSDDKDYSVHIKFDTALNQSVLQKIDQRASAPL